MSLNQEIQNSFFYPIMIFIACFIIVVFSINQIINMATKKPEMLLKDDSKYSAINIIAQNSAPFDSKNFEAAIKPSFPSPQQAQAELKMDFKQIEQLPAAEQNYVIRLSLLEWRLNNLQNQLATNSESLILKTSFWVYSFLIWAGSIVGEKFLTFFTNKLIKKYCGTDIS